MDQQVWRSKTVSKVFVFYYEYRFLYDILPYSFPSTFGHFNRVCYSIKKASVNHMIGHWLKKTGTTPAFRTVAGVTESSVEPSTHLTLTSNDFMNFYTNKNWRHHTDAPQSNSWHFSHLHFTQQSIRALTPCAPRGPWGHIWKKQL